LTIASSTPAPEYGHGGAAAWSDQQGIAATPAKPKPIEQNKPDKRAKTTKKPDVELKQEDVKCVSGGRMPTAVE
jgi:hypothetical protein